MSAGTHTITIPGKFMDTLRDTDVWHGSERDMADSAGRELHDALHAATSTRRGRGYSFTVTLNTSGAVGWLYELAETAAYMNRHSEVSGNDAAETRAAERVMAQCREVLG